MSSWTVRSVLVLALLTLFSSGCAAVVSFENERDGGLFPFPTYGYHLQQVRPGWGELADTFRLMGDPRATSGFSDYGFHFR